MLEQADVAFLVSHWQTQPTPEVHQEATTLIEQFSTDESTANLCAGLSAIAFYSGIEHYKQLSKALFDLALAKGEKVENLLPWHVPVDGLKNHVFSLQEAAQQAIDSQQKNLKVGFLHGHFRLLTPANWANVLLAQEQCDLLILGLEDDWRTKTHKGVKPIAPNWQRWQWVLASGFNGCLTRISRTAYTDKGYTNILKTISPNIYFGNFSLEDETQQKMEKRALSCGATYIALPAQPGLHTSEYVKN